MPLINKKLKLSIMLATSLTMMGCSNQIATTPIWPEKLEAVKLSDGGVCFSPESVKRLSDFKLQLERL